MKKQPFIIVFFLFNCLFAWSQGGFVKTTTPCNNELLKKTPGHWVNNGIAFYPKVAPQQKKEFQNRLDAIHTLMFNLYPSPLGYDAGRFDFATDEEYATQLKFNSSPNGKLNGTEVNGTPIIFYSYTAKFCPYFCGRETYEMSRGQGCESSTTISVRINSLNGFLPRTTFENWADIMCIDGRQIKMMPVLQGNWKGYDIYYPEAGSGQKMVLLHREGILPFIPVTRKQYLDRCIEYLPKMFDAMMKPSPWTTDKKELDEQLKKMQKIKDDVLKYYKDELQASTSAGLLASPAIVVSYIGDIGTNYPIFTTQTAGGRMLVTENPAYFKKDLPKYIPQLVIFIWSDYRGGPDQSLNPYKLIDEKFPIEKVQAMIDK